MSAVLYPTTTGIRYGAKEIQSQISTNTVRAFRNLLIIILCSIPLSLLYQVVEPYIFLIPNVIRVAAFKTEISILPIEPIHLKVQIPSDEKPITGGKSGGSSATTQRAATDNSFEKSVVPTSLDKVVPNSLLENLPELDQGTSSGPTSPTGNGKVNSIGNGVGADSTVVKTTTQLDPNEYFSVDVEVQFNYDELKSLVVYPEHARKLGIEGTVLVGVLIGTSGSILETRVLASANSNLNDAALTAIRKTTFVSAKQNNQEVACWVRIPIVFKIR